MSNHTTLRRSGDNQMQGFRRFLSVSILISMAVVFFGMQLMMIGPLQGRLEEIQTRLDLTGHSMKRLVSARDTVWETNDLLTSLEDQAGHLSGLQNSIGEMAAVQNRLREVAQSSDTALNVLDQITEVQSRLAYCDGQITEAGTQLMRLEQLRDDLIRGTDRTEVADNSLSGIVALQNRVIAASGGYENASAGIASLTDLTQRMIAQSDELQMAAEHFDRFVALQDRVITAGQGLETASTSLAELDRLTQRMAKESESIQVAARQFDEFIGLRDAVAATSIGLDEAREAAGQMAALKDEILRSDEHLRLAEKNARTLVAMNEVLGQKDINVDLAQHNLSGMLEIQHVLSRDDGRVAAAIENLEILEDFWNEVGNYVSDFSELRHTLVELATMESTVGRVARVMKPLAQLGNLRRLSEDEARAAARVILDRRATRLSQIRREFSGDSVNVDAETADPVPLPPEARP